jgi:hypothetical protein
LRVFPDESNLGLLEDLRRGRMTLSDLPLKLRNVARFARAALEYDPGTLQHVSQDLQGDPLFVIAALKSKRRSSASLPLLAYVSAELQSNQKIVEFAIAQDACSLQYASENCRKHRELVMMAVQKCGRMLIHASRDLKQDPELILAAAGQLDLAFDVKDLSLVGQSTLRSLSNDGEIFRYAHSDLLADRDIVATVVQWDGLALRYVSPELRDDHEIVFSAVRQNLDALRYASDHLKHEFWFAVVVVARNWQALALLPEQVRADRRVIVTALKKNFQALDMTPLELQEDSSLLGDDLGNDWHFMLGAIEQDSRAIKYAGESLLQDRGFVQKALRINGRAMRYLSGAWKHDRELRLLARRQQCVECVQKGCVQVFLALVALALLFALASLGVFFTGGV